MLLNYILAHRQLDAVYNWNQDLGVERLAQNMLGLTHSHLKENSYSQVQGPAAP
jgi:hypothetical protein